jgi:hypothetical protein
MTDSIEDDDLYNMTGAFFPCGMNNTDVTRNLEIRLFHEDRNPGLDTEVIALNGTDARGEDIDIVLERDQIEAIVSFIDQTKELY